MEGMSKRAKENEQLKDNKLGKVFATNMEWTSEFP